MKKKRNPSDDLNEHMQDVKFKITCQYAINLIELKLGMLQEEMSDIYSRKVISSISSRIKSPDSIRRKLLRKEKKVSFRNAAAHLNDIVGVRATCFFEDDIYELVEKLRAQPDLEVVKEKDYIKSPKESGYKSFHMIVKIPSFDESSHTINRVEIQLRTVAMDFWAQLDSQLCYKKESQGEKFKSTQKKLAEFALTIAEMDREMLKVRKEIDRL